jgi:hypothetical protein
MLAPLVGVTHEYDAIMLNHQNVSLAKGWELGGWDLDSSDVLDTFRPESDAEAYGREEGKVDSADGGFTSTSLLSRRGKPCVRTYCVKDSGPRLILVNCALSLKVCPTTDTSVRPVRQRHDCLGLCRIRA